MGRFFSRKTDQPKRKDSALLILEFSQQNNQIDLTPNSLLFYHATIRCYLGDLTTEGFHLGLKVTPTLPGCRKKITWEHGFLNLLISSVDLEVTFCPGMAFTAKNYIWNFTKWSWWLENPWKVVMTNCWESSQHNRRKNFISFMIHSGKNKWQMNQHMSNSVINTSEITVSGNFSLNLPYSCT